MKGLPERRNLSRIDPFAPALRQSHIDMSCSGSSFVASKMQKSWKKCAHRHKDIAALDRD
jgi:hypothetical protein